MRHYDEFADTYDIQYAREQETKIVAALEGLHLGPYSVVLDLGCGTGLLFKHVGNSAKLLVGIDVSARILKEAKKRAKRFQNVDVVRAEADYTPFPDQTFDTVFAITLLQNTQDPKRTLKEIGRIAKQDAIVTITALKKEYSLETFKHLLQSTQFNAQTIRINNNLKDYIITCKPSYGQKLASHPNT